MPLLRSPASPIDTFMRIGKSQSHFYNLIVSNRTYRWNSCDWLEFSREWNIPVHHFFRRHVYSASRGHLSRPAATVITFFISALAHELIMGCITKKLRGYGFFAMMLQMPIVMVQRSKWVRGRTLLNNVLFWCSMILGLSMVSNILDNMRFMDEANFEVDVCALCACLTLYPLLLSSRIDHSACWIVRRYQRWKLCSSNPESLSHYFKITFPHLPIFHHHITNNLGYHTLPPPHSLIPVNTHHHLPP